jgi:hypothetical protein
VPRPTDRRRIPDLLLRAPSGVVESARAAWMAQLVDPSAQIEELDDLRRRGLLSDEEFDGLRARIASTEVAISWTAAEPSRPPRHGS